jgi:endonuclease/exonuclease/phosphatase family metal-dependent hydrolase
MTTTKILLFNTGYCTGLDGSLKGYALHFFRYLHTPQRILRSIFSSIDDLVTNTAPDLCCFTEVRRVQQFVHDLWEYPYHHFASKYGMQSVFRRLPYFRSNTMGFFSRRKLPFQKHYLKHGTKKLIYEVRLTDDTSLLIGHLSLRRKTRKKQLQELKELIQMRKHVILCGDFNVFAGFSELSEIIRDCRLRIVNTLHDATFPAIHPTVPLDLFLCSEDLLIERLEVLRSVHASDHLPVLLEVRI